MYACKICGATAKVSADGAIERSCAHTGTVVASMEAVAYGRGGACEGNQLLRFFSRIGRELMKRAHGIS